MSEKEDKKRAREAEGYMLKEKEIQRQRESLEKHGMKGVEEMTKDGKIDEAALVVSHSGLETGIHVMMNSFETMLDRKMKESSEGESFSEEQLEAVIEKVLDKKLSMVMRTISSRLDGMFSSNEGTESEEKEFAGEFDVEEVENSAEEELEVVERRIEAPDVKGVSWAEMTKEQARLVLYSLIQEAEDNGVDIESASAFKRLGGKYNTAYQRTIPFLFGHVSRGRGMGRWKEVLAEYKAYKGQKNIE